MLLESCSSRLGSLTRTVSVSSEFMDPVEWGGDRDEDGSLVEDSLTMMESFGRDCGPEAILMGSWSSGTLHENYPYLSELCSSDWKLSTRRREELQLFSDCLP